MCQIKKYENEPAGERRCNCDTSTARRLRRHNAAAISAFSDQVTPLMDHSKEEPILEEVDMDKLTMSTIRSITDDIKILKDVMFKRLGRDEVITIILEDGTEHSISNRTLPFEIAAIAEKQTVKLGDTINQLVEYRTGITDESIVECDTEERARVLKSFEERVAEKEAILKFKQETWPSIVDENGKYQSSDRAFYLDYKVGNEVALAYKTRCDESNELSAIHDVEKNLTEKGKNPKSLEMTAAKREELLNVLREMRELGGTIAVADNSSKVAVKILREVEKVYPSDWVAASNQDEALRAKTTVGRAHYSGGAYQDEYKVSNKMTMVTTDNDWEPNPLNRYESGEWIKIDNNSSWEDPNTKIIYESNASEGNATWVHSELEYRYSHKDSTTGILIKPKGRNWKLTTIQENAWNYDTKNYENKLVELYARPVSTRNLVSSTAQPELTISGKGEIGYGIGLHEFAHRVENTKTVGAYIESVEEAHIKRRTTDENGVQQKLQKIYVGKKEYARPDNFVDLYMGKEYSQGYREILSTGAEAVFSDSFGGLIGLGRYKSDPEMKGLIVGLWASA